MPLIVGSLVRTSPHVLLLPLQLKDRVQEFLPIFASVSFIDTTVLCRSEFTTGVVARRLNLIDGFAVDLAMSPLSMSRRPPRHRAALAVTMRGERVLAALWLHLVSVGCQRPWSWAG
jgi:hypothetical protein